MTELFNHFGYSDEVTAWEKNPNKEEAFKAFFCDTKAVLGDAIDAGGANDIPAPHNEEAEEDAHEAHPDEIPRLGDG